MKAVRCEHIELHSTEEKASVPSRDKLPIEAGMVPVMRFVCRYRSERNATHVSAKAGRQRITPRMRQQPDKYSLIRFERSINSNGMVPVMFVVLMSKLTVG